MSYHERRKDPVDPYDLYKALQKEDLLLDRAEEALLQKSTHATVIHFEFEGTTFAVDSSIDSLEKFTTEISDHVYQFGKRYLFTASDVVTIAFGGGIVEAIDRHGMEATIDLAALIEVQRTLGPRTLNEFKTQLDPTETNESIVARMTKNMFFLQRIIKDGQLVQQDKVVAIAKAMRGA